jgi:hypothetical protein
MRGNRLYWICSRKTIRRPGEEETRRKIGKDNDEEARKTGRGNES